MAILPTIGIKGWGQLLLDWWLEEHNADGTHSVLGGTMQATNKSGGSVVAGDLGWMNYGADNSFTTSTTQDKSDSIPVIAQASIANDATGTVAFGLLGHITDINVTGTPTIGQYVRQSSSAKLCEGVTTISAGCFAKVSRVTSQFDIAPLSILEYSGFTRTKYMMYPLSAFKMIDESANTGVNGSGIITAPESSPYHEGFEMSHGTSTVIFLAPVQLPHGCTVTSFEVYTGDNATTANTQGKLIRKEKLAATFVEMAVVTFGWDTSGYSTDTDSSITSGEIDNSAYLYHISIETPLNTGNFIVGARLTYTQADVGDLM